MSMKTIVAVQPRVKITVPLKWVDGTIYTKSKTCVTAKSAAEFYTGAKNYNHNLCTEQVTRLQYWQLTPAQQAGIEERGSRMYRRVLRVFKQYLP
jgi:hypothetical protein